MEKNPFLEEDDDDEEEYVYHKPVSIETLTEAQKKRNIKGVELLKNNLKKVIPPK